MMWKLRINFGYWIFFCLVSTAVASFATNNVAEENVSPDMKRNVVLTLKSEANAKTYVIQIFSKNGVKTEQQLNQPQWEGKLAKGAYKFRFKIIFIDETESNWSDERSFEVTDYTISVNNIDQHVGAITTDINGQQNIFLSWTPISEAANYTLSIYQTEQYVIQTLSPSRAIRKNKIFSPVPVKKLSDLKSPHVLVDGLESGAYTLKFVVRDKTDKIIAVVRQNIELYEIDKLKPKILTPANNFVREISWNPVADYKNYQVTVYQKNAELLQALKHSDKNHSGTVFSIPSDWDGGEYTFCVKTHITLNTYSTDSCLDFNIKSGDRTKLAEHKHYRDILKLKDRQYYRHFNLISSNISYNSEFPSLASLVEIDGSVLNLSYSKTNPGFTENINQYYKLNLGYFKLPGKGDLLYDFRLGQEYSYYDSYPLVFKLSAGGALDKLIQATTDSDTATQLDIFSQHLANVFINASIEYNYLDRYAIDVRMGYLKPLFQVMRTRDQKLKQGNVTDYSINAIVNLTNSRDRVEVGYIFKSGIHEFEDRSSHSTSKIAQRGHYINVGYILEAE